MLGCTVLLPNTLTPVLSGMRKGARMQPILRDGQLLVTGDRRQHTAGFYEIIRQSNGRSALSGANYQLEGLEKHQKSSGLLASLMVTLFTVWV
jgi:hypothetical protein